VKYEYICYILSKTSYAYQFGFLTLLSNTKKSIALVNIIHNQSQISRLWLSDFFNLTLENFKKLLFFWSNGYFNEKIQAKKNL